MNRRLISSGLFLFRKVRCWNLPFVNWEQLGVALALIVSLTWILSTVGAELVKQLFYLLDAYREDTGERERVDAEGQRTVMDVISKYTAIQEAQSKIIEENTRALDRLAESIRQAPCGVEGVISNAASSNRQNNS